MASYLFPTFLHDPGEYDRAVDFWQSKWKDLISRLGENALWESPWMGTTFANGNPCRDGNPIFSAASYSKRLAIRLVQVEPAESAQELAIWIEDLAEELGEGARGRELVIAFVLTPQTLTYVTDILSRWITTGEVEIRHQERNFTVPPERVLP